MTAVPALALAYTHLLALLSTNSNYTFFPNDDGVVFAINLNQPELNEAEIAQIAGNIDKTSFFLYTRNNPKDGQQLFIDDLDSVKNSSWDPSRPTNIITHGWHGNKDSRPSTIIRDAFLESGDYNVIVIDWEEAASYYTYWNSASSVPKVAERVSHMLNFLEKKAGLIPKMTKLIGHSLGAHVSGLAARFAEGTIDEVVALDPASPLFSGKGPGSRVDKTDATLVQIIHTSKLGLKDAIGVADFYPNGGLNQPGCSVIDFIGVCAHGRAYLYYAESVLKPKGFRVEEFNVFMGGPHLDRNAIGTYTLDTAHESPFALG